MLRRVLSAKTAGTTEVVGSSAVGGKRPSEHESSHAARSFRLVHHGHEFFILSQPLRAEPAGVLTPAQLDVARAIVRGASNAEIARMRGTSVRTVANQVASILARLDATSRAQIAVKLALVDLSGGAKRAARRR